MDTDLGRVPAVRARALCKQLPSGSKTLRVVDEIDLDIEVGEFVAIVGPSGSGKSTLLGLLAGLDRPTSGGVWLNGQPLHEMTLTELAVMRRREVGFVFQSFQLLANMTALENVMLPLELVGDVDAGDRALLLLARVGLEARSHHYPRQLSGGEQQRVALARAFAASPRVLFADEPTGNLDGKTGDMVLEILSELRRENGTTLLLVTHDLQIAGSAARIVELRDGRVVGGAPPR